MADELWKWCRAQRFSEPMTCRFVAAYGEMSSLLACARDEDIVKQTLVEVGVPAGQRNQMLKAVRALAATLSVDDEAAVAPAAPVPARPTSCSHVVLNGSGSLRSRAGGARGRRSTTSGSG